MPTRRAILAGTGAALCGAVPVVAQRSDPVRRFPRGFVWGFANAAAQTEGDVAGRGRSIWDDFAARPGAIKDGSDTSVGTDFVNRYAEDLDLAAGAGANAFRFSIAWPRVQHEGTGAPSASGFDFYDRLIDAMLARGLEPWPTLYHWDLPSALQARGGWMARDNTRRFADYAALVGRRFRDRLRHILILNEPQVHAMEGHGDGRHGPGLASRAEFFAAAHHLNLAQGLAFDALRATVPHAALGAAWQLAPTRPGSSAPEDVEAAAEYDDLNNRLFLDPALRGRYPARFGADLAPLLRPGDLEAMHRPHDLLGVNYYGPSYIRAAPGSSFGVTHGDLPAGMLRTAMGSPIDEAGLIDVLRDLRDGYGNLPVHITENGASFDDPAPDEAGRIHDAARIDYLRRHLRAGWQATQEGCDLRGYFCWTLTDNWEWNRGYTERFGLVAVDRATLARRPKASLAAFGAWARANAVT